MLLASWNQFTSMSLGALDSECLGWEGGWGGFERGVEIRGGCDDVKQTLVFSDGLKGF